ncbi:MAG: hypothetical protein C0484_26545 [Rhodospirillum sp.]|jgi:hypothetical protein|nr:hypothetical protein [Rhodospirillum sp.]
MKPDNDLADRLGLVPVSIIALGAPAQPVERLMAVQSAIARLVGWLADLRLPRLRFAPPLRSAEQGDRP